MSPRLSASLSFSAGVALSLLAVKLQPFHEPINSYLSTAVSSLLSRMPVVSGPLLRLNDSSTFHCTAQTYRTQLVSLDPLVIYVHDFLHPIEIDAILRASEPLLQPSTVTRYGKKVESDYRTSWSTEIPRDNPTVACIEDRVWQFMGTMLGRGKDKIEPPQVVRYTAGQKFNMHHDWYEEPQREWKGRIRAWNRLASFFAILEANCTSGETYFPHVKRLMPIPKEWADRNKETVWREHEKGGLAFRPIRGNALFWVNLLPDGEGDRRVEHAGLPVVDGVKTAMNIWPREYIGPDAWDQSPEGGT